MSDLPNAAEIVYGPVSFPVETKVKELTTESVLDTANRTVTHVVLTIAVEAWFGKANQAAGQTVDLTVENLVQALNAPGSAFTFRKAGYGDWSVNLPGSRVKDVLWGPMPRTLRVESFGDKSCKVLWRVQVARPVCADATYSRAISQFNWKMAVARDKSGYSKRTITGFIVVPGQRVSPGSPRLADAADTYLERVIPPPLEGFRRTPPSTMLSYDKCRLDFTLLDEEVGPEYPPPGIVDVECGHSVSTEQAFSVKWAGHLSYKAEMARDIPRDVAWRHFNQIMYDHIIRQRGAPYTALGNVPGRNVPIIYRMELNVPNYYGKRIVQFRCSYTFMSSLADILRVSAIFRPMPNSDWRLWATSLANTAFHPRGTARMTFSPSDDAVIDLCMPGNQIVAPDADADAMPGGALRGGVGARGLGLNDIPPPDASWLRWNNALRVEPRDNTSVNKTLPTAPVQFVKPQQQNQYVLNGGGGQVSPPAGPDGGFGGAQVPNVQFGGSLSWYPAGAQDQTIVQVAGRPLWIVIMTGDAARAGYPVVPPALISVGGAQVIPQNVPGCGFGQQIAGNWFGVPVYAAAWRFRYVLDRDPATGVQVTGAPFPSA